MTPFTDEDVKRLKDWLEWEKRPEADEMKKDLKALLVRLEAAEWVCAEWSVMANLDHPCSLNTLYKAWRKAAGK